MPDQRQPDQPIDRNRDLDRSQQIERQDQQGMQGSQTDRQDRQSFEDPRSDRQRNLQGSQTDQQRQGGQGSSSTGGGSISGREQDTGLDMSRGENRDLQQQDRMQTRQDQQGGRSQRDEMSRQEGSYTDEGLGKPYDRDDMEAQSPSDLDADRFGESRSRDDQIGRNRNDS